MHCHATRANVPPKHDVMGLRGTPWKSNLARCYVPRLFDAAARTHWRIRLRVRPFLLLAGLAAATTGCELGMTPDVPVNVAIEDGRFAPETQRLSPGTVVIWRNDGTIAHTIVGPYWNSGTKQPGETFSLRIHYQGTVAYGCSIHPDEKATLVVE